MSRRLSSSKTVRISSILSPALMWATEIPFDDDDGQDRDDSNGAEFKHTELHKVFCMEAWLRDLYNTKPGDRPEFKPAGSIDVLKADALVAARRLPLARNWFRARIVGAANSCSTARATSLVRIFLIDYGEFVDNVPVRTCIRELPRPMAVLAPLAFQLVLAGLVPVTLDINYEVGMKSLTKVIGVHWTQSAYAVTRNAVEESPLRIGELTEIRQDAQRRLHGQLSLYSGSGSQLHKLNDVLVAGEHAMFSERRLIEALSHRPQNNSHVSLLSICGGSGLDVRSVCSSRAVSSSVGDDSFVTAAGGEDDRDGAASVASAARKICEWEIVPRLQSRASAAAAAAAAPKAARPTKPETLVRGKDDDDTLSVWESARENVTRSSRHQSRRVLAVIVPAGIDLGKYLEAQLAAAESDEDDGIGPKQVHCKP